MGQLRTFRNKVLSSNGGSRKLRAERLFERLRRSDEKRHEPITPKGASPVGQDPPDANGDTK